MRLSRYLFRFRWWVLFAIFILGFWAPLGRLAGTHQESTWLWLSGTLSSYRILPIAYSIFSVMGIAILLVLLAALLRTWATAYLGHTVVSNHMPHGEQVVSSGPYRYVRNPLYVGLWLHTVGLSILMPPSGALFVIVAVAILIAFLVHAEEQHLAVEQGEGYAVYRKAVPSFIPALVPRVSAGAEQPRWKQAFLSEIYMWGVVVTYLAFASRYNVTILDQGVLISAGVSVIARGIMKTPMPKTP